MASAGISGKDGDVKISTTQIAEITKWDFKPQAKNVSYISNKTAGYEATVAGPKSGKGNMTGVWDPANPATGVIDVGTAVTLLLYINATQFYSVPAVIDQLGTGIDRAGNIVEWTASFTANGAWTNPVAAGSITVIDDETGEQRPNIDSELVFVPEGELQMAV